MAEQVRRQSVPLTDEEIELLRATELRQVLLERAITLQGAGQEAGHGDSEEGGPTGPTPTDSGPNPMHKRAGSGGTP